MMHLKRSRGASQRGQSIAEIMISLPFMMALVIGLVETGIVFASYIAIVNGAREGAIFASGCKELVDSAQDNDTSCTNSETTANIELYRNRIYYDIINPVSSPLKEGQLQTEDAGCNGDGGDFWAYHNCLKVDRPVFGPVTADCPEVDKSGCPITVTLHYRVKTLTSSARLPYFGRFGLPEYYQLNYSLGMALK